MHVTFIKQPNQMHPGTKRERSAKQPRNAQNCEICGDCIDMEESFTSMKLVSTLLKINVNPIAENCDNKMLAWVKCDHASCEYT